MANFQPVSIRLLSGRPVFVLADGSIFYWRGSNYIRLAADGYHNTFDPGAYDAGLAEAALNYMQGSGGYNYCRVFITSHFTNSGFGLAQPGVCPTWLANLVDFLDRASNHNIRVVLTVDWYPANYSSYQVGSPPAYVEDVNLYYLWDQEAFSQGKFWQDVLTGIQNIAPELLSTILAIDVKNEASVDLSKQPFSLGSGVVTAWDGIYDLNVQTQRQDLIDTSSVRWMTALAEMIKSICPNILVTASVITPASVGKSGYDGAWPVPLGADTRYPLRPLVLMLYSLADYIDVHLYADANEQYNLTTAGLVQATNYLTKPLVMGEFGADRALFPDKQSAAAALKSHLSKSCAYGFTGWGFWTWDTPDPNFWNVTEDSGAMNGVIAPVVWPQIHEIR